MKQASAGVNLSCVSNHTATVSMWFERIESVNATWKTIAMSVPAPIQMVYFSVNFEDGTPGKVRVDTNGEVAVRTLKGATSSGLDVCVSYPVS